MLNYFRMYGRRSAGKRIRMDEQGQEQQGQYDQYGNYYGDQQQQGYDNQAGGSGGQEQMDSSFDPIAFYQQQRSEMLLESSHHVQQSQDEIQRAQLRFWVEPQIESFFLDVALIEHCPHICK